MRDADQIAVLDKGRIVELGTFKELNRENSAFQQLIKRQL